MTTPDRPADVTALRDALVRNRLNDTGSMFNGRLDALIAAVRADATRAADAQSPMCPATCKTCAALAADERVDTLDRDRLRLADLLADSERAARAAEAEVAGLRAALWSEHIAGEHDGHHAYGDDGEMQCHGVDYLRDPVTALAAQPAAPDIRERVETEWVNGNVDTAAMVRILAEPSPRCPVKSDEGYGCGGNVGHDGFHLWPAAPEAETERCAFEALPGHGRCDLTRDDAEHHGCNNPRCLHDGRRRGYNCHPFRSAARPFTPAPR